jgi:hypothetical protein
MYVITELTVAAAGTPVNVAAALGMDGGLSDAVTLVSVFNPHASSAIFVQTEAAVTTARVAVAGGATKTVTIPSGNALSLRQIYIDVTTNGQKAVIEYKKL